MSISIVMLTTAFLFFPSVGLAGDEVFDLGVEQLKTGNFEEAQRLLTTVIDLSPDHKDAYVYRSVARISLGRYREAIEDSTAALAIDSRDFRAYSNRGYARAQTGDMQGAIGDFNSALAINPMALDTLCYRAAVYLAQGQYDLAIDDCNRAVQTAPELAKAYSYRGFAWENKGNWQAAISDYERAIELDPDYAHAMNNLAWVLATCPDGSYRDGERAIELVVQATEANRQGNYLDTLAAAYAESGRFSDAVHIQKQVVAQLPKDLPPEKRAEYTSRLRRYQANRPYRQTAAGAASAVTATVAAPAKATGRPVPADVSRPADHPAATAPKTLQKTHPYTVQVASNQDRETSFRKARELQQAGYPAFTSFAQVYGRGIWERVYIGHYMNRTAAKKALLKVKAGGIGDAVIVKAPYGVWVALRGSAAGRQASRNRLVSMGYFPYSIQDRSVRLPAGLLVGAFENQETAASLARRLRSSGFEASAVRR